jgi:hypothetical protein
MGVALGGSSGQRGLGFSGVDRRKAFALFGETVDERLG